MKDSTVLILLVVILAIVIIFVMKPFPAQQQQQQMPNGPSQTTADVLGIGSFLQSLGFGIWDRVSPNTGEKIVSSGVCASGKQVVKADGTFVRCA